MILVMEPGCTAPQTKLSTQSKQGKSSLTTELEQVFDTIAVNCLIAGYVTSIKDLVVPGLC